MKNNIFWTGYSGQERHVAIRAIADMVNRHGYVVDFTPFSDISLTMRIEIEEFQIDTLYDALAAIMEMKEFDHLNSTSSRERTVYLNITFIHGRGDLRQDIPSVPG